MTTSNGKATATKKRTAQLDWTKYANRLNMREIYESCEEAKQAYIRGDLDGLWSLVNFHGQLAFVFDNYYLLMLRGIYEKALLRGYTGVKINHHKWDLSVIKDLFHFADRDMLLAAGDPLPPGDMFTLYRGVSGVGKFRKPSGPAWTDDLETAKLFAQKLCRPDPAVYTATVRREDVLYFTNCRHEREFGVFVHSPRRMAINLSGPYKTPAGNPDPGSCAQQAH